MKTIALTVALLTPSLVAQDALTASPAAPSLTPEMLQLLGEQVESLLANDSIVGAELHVIENRRTVFHEAFGFADRDEARPMTTDSLFCIRSMTKPLVGTAIQMLLDEGRLTLDTEARDILDEFDTPDKAGITIEQLLTHTTGLPLTTITSPLAEYSSLRDVVAEAAATTLQFEPGTSFQYSDAGSDTLGAIVAEVTGMPVEAFIQERILDPLEMDDTFTLLSATDDADIARIPSAYSGAMRAWSRHWTSSAEPIFPIFLTSQSLYSTTSDYARFLALWMDGGRELLSDAAITRGLTPREHLPVPGGFEGLETFYAQQWMVYADADGELVAFGHNGSDGTHAWAWPERDLIVLFFTQTRGTLAGYDLEAAIDQLLIRGDVNGHREKLRARAEAPVNLERYAGIYWDEDNMRAFYDVRLEGERLSISRPGGFVSGLVPTGTPGHFEIEREPGRVLQFEAPEEGVSPAFMFPFSSRTERQTRHRPNPRLPTVESIIADLRDAHGSDALDDVGAIRLTGKLAMRSGAITGRVEAVFNASCARMDVAINGSSEIVWVTEGDRVFHQVNGGETTELHGELREQVLLDHPIRRWHNWQADYASIEPLRPIVHGSDARMLVHTVSREGSSSTKLINLDSGLLTEEDRIALVPGMGKIGLQLAYRDYRDIEGVMIPFQINMKYSNALLGEAKITYETVETGVDANEILAPPIDH